MSDLIKREDVIRAIEELPNAYNGWSDAYDKAYIIGTLEEVPSADRPQDREQFGKTEQLRGLARLERQNVGRSNRDRATEWVL